MQPTIYINFIVVVWIISLRMSVYSIDGSPAEKEYPHYFHEYPA